MLTLRVFYFILSGLNTGFSVTYKSWKWVLFSERYISKLITIVFSFKSNASISSPIYFSNTKITSASLKVQLHSLSPSPKKNWTNHEFLATDPQSFCFINIDLICSNIERRKKSCARAGSFRCPNIPFVGYCTP